MRPRMNLRHESTQIVNIVRSSGPIRGMLSAGPTKPIITLRIFFCYRPTGAPVTPDQQ